MAIARQNSRSTSRRSAGAPGDFIAERPVNAVIHPAGLPINTSTIKVLRRPVESTQYTSIRYAERLDQIGAARSVGSKGDSYDNAAAESLNSLYKKELIDYRGDWNDATDVTLATMEWVAWYNAERLHSFCGNIPPAEFEETFHSDAADAGAPA